MWCLECEVPLGKSGRLEVRVRGLIWAFPTFSSSCSNLALSGVGISMEPIPA